MTNAEYQQLVDFMGRRGLVLAARPTAVRLHVWELEQRIRDG